MSEGSHRGCCDSVDGEDQSATTEGGGWEGDDERIERSKGIEVVKQQRSCLLPPPETCVHVSRRELRAALCRHVRPLRARLSLPSPLPPIKKYRSSTRVPSSTSSHDYVTSRILRAGSRVWPGLSFPKILVFCP